MQQNAQWQAEGRGESSGLLIYPKNGEIAPFYFMSTGQDDDPMFEVFFAHEWPKAPGQLYPPIRYCPVLSGHDLNYDCVGCKMGYKVKKRMAMWLYILSQYVTTLREGETLPMVNFNNQMRYERQVQGVRLWETSAWRDSCLGQIFIIGGQLGGDLQGMMMQLTARGDSKERRYDIATIPGTGHFPADIYQQYFGDCKPIRQYLAETLKAPDVVAAPQVPQTPQMATLPPTQAPSLALPPLIVQAAAAPVPVAPLQVQVQAPAPPPQPFQPPQATAVAAPPPTPIETPPFTAESIIYPATGIAQPPQPLVVPPGNGAAPVIPAITGKRMY